MEGDIERLKAVDKKRMLKRIGAEERFGIAARKASRCNTLKGLAVESL